MGHPSSNMQATMTSVYNLGCFAGAMSTIWTGDIFGRPRQIIIGSAVIAIGAIIQTTSYSVAQMMVGRVVAGLGTGMYLISDNGKLFVSNWRCRHEYCDCGCLAGRDEQDAQSRKTGHHPNGLSLFLSLCFLF